MKALKTKVIVQSQYYEGKTIQYDDVIETRVQDGLYCILFNTGTKSLTHKYPISSLIRIIHEYPIPEETSF